MLRMVDRQLMHKAIPDRHNLWDRTLSVIGTAASGAKLWLAAAAVLAATGEKGRRAARDGLLALAVGEALNQAIAKPLFQRPRPLRFGRLTRLGGRDPSTASFPSAHTAAAAAFTVAAGAAQPATAAPLAALAAVVAWSRISSQRHFPTDVLAGAALGIGCGLAVHRWSVRHTPRPEL